MARLLVGGVALAAALAALPVGSEELNSERIERRFGSYGVAVLEQSADLRIANLYSVEDAEPICRTFAIVRFELPVPETLRAPHKEILAGGSIGAVLKDAGWQVSKSHLYLGGYDASADASRLADLMSLSLPTALAMHVYRLDAVRGNDTIAYATIIELHHPDYLSERSLKALYDGSPSQPLPSAGLGRIGSWCGSTSHRRNPLFLLNSVTSSMSPATP